MKNKLQIVYKPLEELNMYLNNPRLNDDAVEYVANSIKEFGFKVPIVIDKDNVIVAGHTRYKASQKLGLKEVPCIIADDLNEEQVKAFRLADNKVSEQATWDYNLLNIELDDITDLDMTNFGFDLDFNTEEEKEIIEDEVPDVPEEPKAKLGDIYQLGNHRLMCGDSTSEEDVSKLMNGVKADMVFTDPPYNIDFKDSKGRSIKNDNIGNEFENFINKIILRIKENIEKGYIYLCFSQRYIKDYLKCMVENNIDDYDLIIWEKDTAMRLGKDYKNYYEPIWLYRINNPIFYGKKEFEHNIWHIESIHSAKSTDDFGNTWFKGGNKNLTLHPTQKPIKVSAKAINNSSKEGNIVLDLFGGSGSTLIACEQLNRKCYMMELDPHYIDVIIQRWENFTGEKAIKVN